ncbi:MAG: PAS domain S-box protein [Bacteroidales bacterium]|nr:PAS domain S-box protein [Bacteroidales bacterium]
MRILAFIFFFGVTFLLYGNRQEASVLYGNLKNSGFSENEIADSLMQSYSLYYVTNPYKSLEYINLAKEIYEKENNKEQIIYVNIAYGNIYSQFGLNKIALSYFSDAYKELKLRSDTIFGWLLIDIGNVYFAEKLYDLAESYYNEALSIFLIEKNLLGQSVVYLNYGLISEKKNETSNAFNHFNKCVEIRKSMNNPFLVAHVLAYKARLYISVNDYDNAMLVAKEAESQLRLINNIESHDEYVLQFYNNYSLTAQIFFLKEDYDSALIEINHGIQYLNNITDSIRLIDAYQFRGNIYLKMNSDKALPDFLKALELAQIHSMNKKNAHLYAELANYYFNKRDYNKAQSYFRNYISVNDSLDMANDVNFIVSLQKAIDDYIKEKDENYLKEKQSVLNIIIIFLSIILLVLIVLMFYIYYFRLRNAKKLNHILDSAFDGIIIHNNGIIKYVNKTFESFSGYTFKELKNKRLYDYFPQEVEYQMINNVFENKKVIYQTKFLAKNGLMIDVEMEGNTIIFTKRKQRILVVKDMSEKIKYDEQIQLFKTIVEQNYNSIVITDTKGNIEYVNPSFSRLTGYSADFVLGKNPKILKSDFHNEAYYKDLWKTINDGKHWSGIFKNIKKNGDYFWEEATITPIKDLSGRILKFAAVKQDITKRKNLEDNYKKYLEQLSKVFDSINAIVFILDFESEKFIFSNEYSKQVFSLNENSSYKNTFFNNDTDIIPLPKDKLILQQKCLKKDIRLEMYIPVLKGWYDVDLQLIRWLDNKDTIMLIAFDVNERKQSIEDLNELNAMKDKFFSILAHDLRNPFQSLIGITRFLLSDVNLSDVENVKLMLGHVNETAEFSYRLLENLLEWSRSQVGLIHVNKAVLNLYVIVSDVVGLLKSNTNQKNISIDINFNEEIKVFADKDIVSTVLRNLIGNAIKFSHKNGSIIIDAEEIGNNIHVSVTDFGLGIPIEVKDRLLRLDTKYSSTGTAGEKGTGLGLVLCKDLIEKNGGTIHIESEFGKGSRFIFTLSKPHENIN